MPDDLRKQIAPCRPPVTPAACTFFRRLRGGFTLLSPAMKERNIEPDVWKYALPGGWEALAGKTDADNDLLSLKTARANDLWFHVHGLPGSHVILRGPEGAPPDAATIKQAAAIAAWHSKARNAGIVPVSCTEAKNVSKPRGAKPGTVTIKREKTIKVRPAVPGMME